jgi:hypothetical protein
MTAPDNQPPYVVGPTRPMPPGYYQQQPPAGYPYAQPPLPPKKSMSVGKILLIVIGCVVGACGIFGVVGLVLGNTDDAGTSTSKAATAAGLNQPARDGKFQFTVRSVQCGIPSVGSGLFAEKAQGEFCVAEVDVANIGKKAQSFAGDWQKAHDAKGAEYSNDGAAEFAANDNNQTLFDQINPGNQITGKVVFDVPAGTKLTSLELHDSVFSSGVRINVS